jgi:hypothetical protein
MVESFGLHQSDLEYLGLHRASLGFNNRCCALPLKPDQAPKHSTTTPEF